jgi:hypothetical protein
MVAGWQRKKKHKRAKRFLLMVMSLNKGEDRE